MSTCRQYHAPLLCGDVDNCCSYKVSCPVCWSSWWLGTVRVLLSFGTLLVPFQRAKVSNCLLKDEAVQRYCCRHYVNGCAAHVRGCVDCPSKRSTVQRIQLCHAATPACIAQLQCRAKAMSPSNASKKHMSCCICHCKLYFCAGVPYACLPAVMFNAP